jgi:AraC family transcriptional regulator of adaptative response / DNA-3-methyladenine glycosylase II
MLDAKTCEEAMIRRDPSFDGLFFVGVRTTGIYCRPVCKVRMPRRENVTFHPSAAAAERAGYRPCLRCRPETAPFCPAWKGTRTTVERALKLIEDGTLDAAGVEDLAARVGVGSRRLSRLFAEHLGASPLQIAGTLRVQRAKRFLTETDLPISEVAARSGFPSARRMSAAFAETYGRPPSSVRRAATPAVPGRPERTRAAQHGPPP